MNIIPLKIGFVNVFVIRDSGSILIDSGPPGKAAQIITKMKKSGISPDDIKLIIITHGHIDHAGSVSELKNIIEAPVIMHRLDADNLELGLNRVPAGAGLWGNILKRTLSGFSKMYSMPSAAVDIKLTDQEYNLDFYGINGRILFTPGHTDGSISVLLNNGAAIVGDLAMNLFPLNLRPGLPVLADHFENVIKSWKYLIHSGARVVYPAHGNPFSINIIQKILNRHNY